jgi:hypothetical protein
LDGDGGDDRVEKSHGVVEVNPPCGILRGAILERIA